MTFSKDVSFFDKQPMFICDQPTLSILDANEAAVNLLGFSKEELLGKRVIEIAKPVSKESILSIFKPDKASRKEKYWLIKNSKGKELYFQISVHLITYKGKPAKFLIAHDVSGRFNSPKRKGVLSKPLSIDNFPLAEIEWDLNLNIIRWSDNAEKLFGWTEEEAIKTERLLEKFIHPGDRKYVRDEHQKSLEGRNHQVSIINRNITKDGRTIYCEWYNSFLYDKDGNIISVYSLTHDVTGREQAMEHAKRSMRSYQDLFNSISDAIYLLEPDGTIIEANNGLEFTFGYTREEVIGRHYSMLAAPGKYKEEKMEKIMSTIQEGNPSQYSGWGKKKNGEVFPSDVLVNAGNYFGSDVLIIIERDTSDQKEYQDALKKREELFSKLFNSAPIGIALLNKHKEVELVNEGFEHLFGWREEELKGRELDDFIVPEKGHEKAARLSESEKVLQVTEKRIRKDGRFLEVIIYAVPVVVESQVVGIYGIYVDITKRQKAEAQIKESLKEKEILLAEIHHRVKNNLAVITGLLELQSYSAEDENAKSILADSQMRVNSIALVHEKLYQSESFSEIEVGQYLQELTDEVHRSLSTRGMEVDVHLEVDKIGLSITQAIPTGLLVNEIMTNSFKHAFKGMEQGRICILLKKADDNALLLKIKDNGVGMPVEQETDVKSSLGMTLIKTLAKQLGATFSYRNEEGLVFEFKFKKEQVYPD
ncbi:MAG: PAS domain S-box protein [Balneolaceae bacterium]|nr:PAS domain S-box protein [Balneolaceae bacterium]